MTDNPYYYEFSASDFYEGKKGYKSFYPDFHESITSEGENPYPIRKLFEALPLNPSTPADRKKLEARGDIVRSAEADNEVHCGKATDPGISAEFEDAGLGTIVLHIPRRIAVAKWRVPEPGTEPYTLILEVVPSRPEQDIPPKPDRPALEIPKLREFHPDLWPILTIREIRFGLTRWEISLQDPEDTNKRPTIVFDFEKEPEPVRDRNLALDWPGGIFDLGERCIAHWGVVRESDGSCHVEHHLGIGNYDSCCARFGSKEEAKAWIEEHCGPDDYCDDDVCE